MTQITWRITLAYTAFILHSSTGNPQPIATVLTADQTNATNVPVLLQTNTLGNPGIEAKQSQVVHAEASNDNDLKVNSTYVSDTPSIGKLDELNKSSPPQSLSNQQKQENASQNKTDSEADDMNKKEPLEDIDLARQVFTNGTFGLPKFSDLTSVTKADDVGQIQAGQNEDDREANFSSFVEGKIVLDDGPLVTQSEDHQTGQVPVIVASIFVILCVVGYTALLMWRRYLERKYGNREMLINEEFDPSDMRHFSI